MKRFFSIVLLSAFGLLPAVAQDAPPPSAEVPIEAQPGTFGEMIDVRVINLEVVVTNRKGERVTGLLPEDFVLRVDGAERPVEYFAEVVGGVAAAPGEAADFLSLPALAPGEPVGTSYLVFIDEFFSRPEDLQRVLNGLLDGIPLLAPEDRMAIVAYDGQTLEMLTTWSQSTEHLVRTIQKARLRPTFGRLRQANLDSLDVVRRLGLEEFRLGDADEDLTTELDPEELQQVRLLASQVERVVSASTAALRSFGGPPGRKVMMILSGGWPKSPARWVAQDPRRTLLDGAALEHADLFDPLVNTANRLNYSLYPVEVKAFEVEAINAREGGATFNSMADRVEPLRGEMEREDEEERSLAFLARETGGRALLNMNSDRALAKVVEDTRTYYWLGFTPEWKGDGRNHTVRIETRRDDLRSRSRRGFSDLSRSAEVEMMVESALLFGNTPSTEPLTVERGGVERSGMGKMRLPLYVYVPVGELTFIPREDDFIARAELRVAVLDANGNTLEEIPMVPLNFAIAKLPEEGEHARYDTSIELRKIRHDVVVSIYDTLSGKMLATRLTVEPE